MTIGSGADTFTTVVGDSVVRSAQSFVAAIAAAGDTITFANGVDVITDFTAGTSGDIFASDSITVAAIPTVFVGATVAALTASTNFMASGTWNTSTKVFTVLATGTGADTLIIPTTAAAAQLLVATNTAMVVLIGVVDTSLVAANFI